MSETDMIVPVEKKTFLLGKRGQAFIPLRITEISHFYYSSKLTFAVDFGGNKFIVDKSLNELEALIDSRLFFRINRTIIININSIKEFKSIEFGKISIIVRFPELISQDIIVSQPTAPFFKEWISNL